MIGEITENNSWLQQLETSRELLKNPLRNDSINVWKNQRSNRRMNAGEISKGTLAGILGLDLNRFSGIDPGGIFGAITGRNCEWILEGNYMKLAGRLTWKSRTACKISWKA